jgi:hypothetical protein
LVLVDPLDGWTVTYKALDGACRTEEEENGIYPHSNLDGFHCARACTADPTCVAYEHTHDKDSGVKNHCELHADAVGFSVPMEGVMCYLKQWQPPPLRHGHGDGPGGNSDVGSSNVSTTDSDVSEIDSEEAQELNSKVVSTTISKVVSNSKVDSKVVSTTDSKLPQAPKSKKAELTLTLAPNVDVQNGKEEPLPEADGGVTNISGIAGTGIYICMIVICSFVITCFSLCICIYVTTKYEENSREELGSAVALERCAKEPPSAIVVPGGGLGRDGSLVPWVKERLQRAKEIYDQVKVEKAALHVTFDTIIDDV